MGGRLDFVGGPGPVGGVLESIFLKEGGRRGGRAMMMSRRDDRYGSPLPLPPFPPSPSKPSMLKNLQPGQHRQSDAGPQRANGVRAVPA